MFQFQPTATSQKRKRTFIAMHEHADTLRGLKRQ
jgi:hypothetical protein